MHYLVICCLVVFLTNIAHASDEYIVSGNTFSKDRYVKSLIKNCKENNSNTSIQELEQCLMNSEKFSEVKISSSVSESGKDINQTLVHVKDRWPIIPVPSFSVSSSSSSTYGLMLVDTNFLGFGKLAVAGGSFSSSGNSLVLMYSDDAVAFSKWIFKGLVYYSSKDFDIYNREDLKYTIDGTTKSLEFGTGYSFSKNLALRINARKTIEYFYFDSANRNKNQEKEGYFLEENFSYEDYKFKFYFNEGWQSFLNFTEEISRNDDLKKYQTSFFNIEYQKNVFKDHALQISYQNIFVNNSKRFDSMRVGGAKGSRGIPDESYLAKSLNALSIDYHIPLAYRNYGIWTIAPFVDFTSLKSSTDQQEIYDADFYSCGIGGYLFFKTIAIPGVGFIYGHNSKFASSYFSLTIGRSI